MLYNQNKINTHSTILIILICITLHKIKANEINIEC